MRARWMFLMLLSCRLSHADNSQDSCACKDQIRIVCAPAGGDVLMPCPKLTGEDMTFNLFKDDEVIYNQTCIGDPQASDCKPPYTRAGVTLLENTDNNSFSLTLTGVKAGSYGIYGCEGTRTLPPPYVTRTLWMLLLVEGHQCNFHQDDGTPGHQHDGFLWIWILGLALLGTYSLAITIVILVKWRTSDSQRDYVNTRPKTHKDRLKKTGL